MKSSFRKLFIFLFLFNFFIESVFAQTLGLVGENLKNAFTTITAIIVDKNALIGIVFLGLLFGLYAIFRGLIRFFFSRSGQFHTKEINVISFMISLISTSGFVFMFREKPELFVIFFGGIFGLALIVGVSVVIFKYFYGLAKHVREESKDDPTHFDRILYWLYILGGLFLSIGLVLGYTHLILAQADCFVNPGYQTTIYDSSHKIVATTENCQKFSLFGTIYEWASTLFAWIITILIFLIPVFLVSRLKGSIDNRQEEIYSNPNLRNAKNLIKRIKNKVSEIDSYFKNFGNNSVKNIFKGPSSQTNTIENYLKNNNDIEVKLKVLKDDINNLFNIEVEDLRKLINFVDLEVGESDLTLGLRKKYAMIFDGVKLNGEKINNLIDKLLNVINLESQTLKNILQTKGSDNEVLVNAGKFSIEVENNSNLENLVREKNTLWIELRNLLNISSDLKIDTERDIVKIEKIFDEYKNTLSLIEKSKLSKPLKENLINAVKNSFNSLNVEKLDLKAIGDILIGLKETVPHYLKLVENSMKIRNKNKDFYNVFIEFVLYNFKFNINWNIDEFNKNFFSRFRSFLNSKGIILNKSINNETHLYEFIQGKDFYVQKNNF